MEPDQSPFIELDQFLKLMGAVGTGGQAKRVIQGGDVRVNGQTETRRRRKLRAGDSVEFEGQAWMVAEST
jgi:ribosome-associated protein